MIKPLSPSSLSPPFQTNAHLFTTSNTRYLALHTRNPLAHSAFIYSVITTRIYCRPTCSSRLARRSNIVFHDSPAQAAADGFRACKRCTPDDDGGDGQVTMVKRVCELIRGEREGVIKWSVRALAMEVGLTESHFCRVFKKVTGLTIGEYRSSIRVKELEAFSAFTPSLPAVADEIEGEASQFFGLLSQDTQIDEVQRDAASREDWNSKTYQELFDGALNLDPLAFQVDHWDFSFTDAAAKEPGACFGLVNFDTEFPLDVSN